MKSDEPDGRAKAVDELLEVARVQAETVRRAVDDWWRAKRAGEDQPGRIYGRRVVTACWELHETVERMRDEDPCGREAINRLLKQFRDALGVDRDGLWFAARAVSHLADATVGGKTARYFGGPPVTSSTNSVQQMEVVIGQSREAVEYVDDVTITITGQNPNRRIVIAADVAREAASYLVDELSKLVNETQRTERTP